jgi:hypothetical protein
MMRTWHRGALVVSVIALAIAGPLFAQGPSCGEATVLGLELSGELVAPVSVVSQIAQDLAIIREAHPAVAEITAYPSWAPGMLLVSFTEPAWVEYLAGSYAGLDSLNGEYGMVVAHQYLYVRMILLESQECYNPTVLADAYSTLGGVQNAYVNGTMGGDDDITCMQLGQYTFEHGYGDCDNGCAYTHYWDFSVIDGVATLVREYGDPLSGVSDGGSTGGIRLRQNHPNPFNPETSVNFALGEAAFVSVDIYDLGGRLVCALFAGDMPAGDHEIAWRGKDSVGNAVASGVYICCLKAGASVVSRKMVLAD